MVCEFCHGTGKILVPRMNIAMGYDPCPECNGTGLQHCCEGLCEQPDDWPDNPVEADTFGRKASVKRTPEGDQE